MSSLILRCPAGVAMVAALLAGCGSRGPAGPILAADRTTHEFAPGPELRPVAEFALTNTGKGQLVIEKIVPDCGCTIADAAKNELARNGASSFGNDRMTSPPGPQRRRPMPNGWPLTWSPLRRTMKVTAPPGVLPANSPCGSRACQSRVRLGPQ